MGPSPVIRNWTVCAREKVPLPGAGRTWKIEKNPPVRGAPPTEATPLEARTLTNSEAKVGRDGEKVTVVPAASSERVPCTRPLQRPQIRIVPGFTVAGLSGRLNVSVTLAAGRAWALFAGLTERTASPPWGREAAAEAQTRRADARSSEGSIGRGFKATSAWGGAEDSSRSRKQEPSRSRRRAPRKQHGRKPSARAGARLDFEPWVRALGSGHRIEWPRGSARAWRSRFPSRLSPTEPEDRATTARRPPRSRARRRSSSTSRGDPARPTPSGARRP